MSNLVPELKNDAHRALPDVKACITLIGILAKTYNGYCFPFQDWVTHNSLIKSNNANGVPASEKQLSYIDRLGGKRQAVLSKGKASTYINELKIGTKKRTYKYVLNYYVSSVYCITLFIPALLGLNSVEGGILLVAALSVLPQLDRIIFKAFKSRVPISRKYLISFILIVIAYLL